MVPPDTLSTESGPQRRLAWLKQSLASLRRLLTVSARQHGHSARRLALPVPAYSVARAISHSPVTHVVCDRFSMLREVVSLRGRAACCAGAVLLCAPRGGCAGSVLGAGGRGLLLIFCVAVAGRYYVGLPRPCVTVLGCVF